MPESYAPVILARKAAKMRKETGNQNIVARSDLESKSWNYVITHVMARPFRMLIHESIVLFTCIYLSLAYAIFYLYFEAYPIIFQGPDSIYHFNAGQTGLPSSYWNRRISMFLAVFGLRLISCESASTESTLESNRRIPTPAISIAWEDLCMLSASSGSAGRHMQMSIGSWPFSVASPSEWVFLLIFMAMLNYLTDAYEDLRRIRPGIASTCRSVFGALLPLASKSMFDALGIHWACSLLAFLFVGSNDYSLSCSSGTATVFGRGANFARS